MRMADWVSKLDGFLTLNDRDTLTDAGRVSHELALEHANREFVAFKEADSTAYESDFDRFSAAIMPPPTEGEGKS